ncbi:MAG: stage II sporulation protein R [Paenibacillaceae bacterium]
MGTRKQARVYLYIAFALIMLIMSWESNLASAALMNATIPEQSIRIRILANSDRVEDQWMKKAIRDAITANVNSWSLNSKNIEDARNEVNNHLPELSALVGGLLAKYDYTYGYQVELGKVHFPAKIFGNVTYPAGEYEALRVTLGAGQGQNWWCVLFPPLCFGSAIKVTAADGIELTENSTATRVYQAPVQDGDDVEVKFFVWEKTKKFGGFIKGLFS